MSMTRTPLSIIHSLLLMTLLLPAVAAGSLPVLERPAGDGDESSYLLTRLNDERQLHQLPILSSNTQLQAAASAKAQL